MSYYHLSYDLIDVEPGDNEIAFSGLVKLIIEKLGGAVHNRPTRSTLIFSSAYGFERVRNEIYAWSQMHSSYYVVSEIVSLPQSDVLCRMVANSSLEEGLRKTLADIKKDNAVLS